MGYDAFGLFKPGSHNVLLSEILTEEQDELIFK
jgi:hypothetical protein